MSYDYGFRQQDPQLCMWHGLDALAEQYVSTSPYAYCGDDPINQIDVDGRSYKTYMQEHYGTSGYRGASSFGSYGGDYDGGGMSGGGGSIFPKIFGDMGGYDPDPFDRNHFVDDAGVIQKRSSNNSYWFSGSFLANLKGIILLIFSNRTVSSNGAVRQKIDVGGNSEFITVGETKYALGDFWDFYDKYADDKFYVDNPESKQYGQWHGMYREHGTYLYDYNGVISIGKENFVGNAKNVSYFKENNKGGDGPFFASGIPTNTRLHIHNNAGISTASGKGGTEPSPDDWKSAPENCAYYSIVVSKNELHLYQYINNKKSDIRIIRNRKKVYYKFVNLK